MRQLARTLPVLILGFGVAFGATASAESPQATTGQLLAPLSGVPAPVEPVRRGSSLLNDAGDSAHAGQPGPLFGLRSGRDDLMGRWASPADENALGAWDVGAFVGYQFSDDYAAPTAAGLNLQLSTGGIDNRNSKTGWLLQPGIDYTMPVAPALQMNARLFSTYATEDNLRGETGTENTLGRLDTEGGFRDVGLNLGVGYTVTDKWSIETQAGYARGIGNREKTTPDAENENPHQFFGGVIVNYRF